MFWSTACLRCGYETGIDGSLRRIEPRRRCAQGIGAGDGPSVTGAHRLGQGENQMRILIAEDDPISRRMLEATLQKWGHQIVSVEDGAAAWHALEPADAPQLAILDWMMPGMDGVEVCRRVRQSGKRLPTYAILLTAKGQKEDIVHGFEAGADDYVTKPFDREELRARINVGVRIVELQTQLGFRVQELEAAIAREKLLVGLLPICCYCKKIRDDQNYWQAVDS